MVAAGALPPTVYFATVSPGAAGVDNTVHGRASSLGSSTSDVSWTSNASNNGVLLDLPAHASFNAFIAIPVAAFADVAGMNLRIDTLVSNQHIIVG